LRHDRTGECAMKIPYYHIDAFTTESSYSGNPAGVCILNDWLPDDVLQSIAIENNLSETAFIIEKEDHFELRWFTPTLEVDLCGHATLAPSFLIMNVLHPHREEVTFRSNAGELYAKRKNDLTEINFPSRPPRECSDMVVGYFHSTFSCPVMPQRLSGPQRGSSPENE